MRQWNEDYALSGSKNVTMPFSGSCFQSRKEEVKGLRIQWASLKTKPFPKVLCVCVLLSVRVYVSVCVYQHNMLILEQRTYTAYACIQTHSSRVNWALAQLHHPMYTLHIMWLNKPDQNELTHTHTHTHTHAHTHTHTHTRTHARTHTRTLLWSNQYNMDMHRYTCLFDGLYFNVWWHTLYTTPFKQN